MQIAFDDGGDRLQLEWRKQWMFEAIAADAPVCVVGQECVCPCVCPEHPEEANAYAPCC